MNDLFDYARQQREQGMARVDEAADPDWKDEADAFILDYLRTHATLFVDDLWQAGLPKPPSMRALGPRLLAAARSGWMRKTSVYRPSVRSNLTEKPVWESLVYER